jgi:hypothetical protein
LKSGIKMITRGTESRGQDREERNPNPLKYWLQKIKHREHSTVGKLLGSAAKCNRHPET